LAGERARVAGGDAARRLAGVAGRALRRRSAVAARHAEAVLLAALNLRRHAAEAVLARVGAEAADVALWLVPVRVGAGAERRVGPGDEVARHLAGAEAVGAAAAAAVGVGVADVAGDAATGGDLADAAGAGHRRAHAAAAVGSARAGLAVERAAARA